MVCVFTAWQIVSSQAPSAVENSDFYCWPVPSCRIAWCPSIMKSASTAMAIWVLKRSIIFGK